MVLNATFNNIPVISWQSVLLVEETGVPGENHRPHVNSVMRGNNRIFVDIVIAQPSLPKLPTPHRK